MKVATLLPLLLSLATLSQAGNGSLPFSPPIDATDAPDLYQDQLTRDSEVLYAGGYLGERLEKRATDAELYGAQTTPPAPVFRYGVGTTKVRGVSLGGWLVLESFITPSMFKGIDPRIVDEWTFGQHQTKAVAQTALMRHWTTWITEADFAAIAAAGLNHVRIPIGYWAFQVATGEPFVQGSLFFLDRAIAWAAKYNLKVMIDLHGAPGGQNGFDNSGRAGVLKWTTTYNQQRTRNVLQTISAEYAKLKYRNVVTAIQVINEPAGYYAGVPEIVRKFYTSAYGIIRRHGTKHPNSILFTMSDAFMGMDYWAGFMSGPGYTDVAFDIHQYSTFDTTKIAFNNTQRIAYQCSLGVKIARSEKRIRTIVGEWTIAPTDCVGGGPLYSRIGNCAGKTGDSTQWSKAYKIWLRKFYEVQTQVYEQGSGWIMWTWRLESGDDWSYSAGLRGGWIPRVPTRKLYGDQCA
uniref:Beta-1 3-glucanase n=1 Tax=Glaciozyma antarctica (strain PI12) TaxID=1332765 RepID=A0A182AUG2_GLAA1|nr:beta-1 3-glucanase [Glaciozyma antarctica PI12]